MQPVSFTKEQPKELLVSPSQLRAWKECPKKHDFIYHQGLKTRQRSVFFDKGNYTHELMHVYYQLLQQSGRAPGDDFLVSALLSRIRNDVAQHAEAGNVNVYNSVMKLISRYVVTQSPKIDRGMTIRGIEQEIRCPTGLYAPDGREIVFFGFADLIYSMLRGDVVIRDHKTGSNPRRWSKESIEADFQLLCYGSWIYKLMEVVPKVEINFCNTYEYAKKPSDNQFALYVASHSETVYANFYAETIQLTEDMLSSGPTPHYSTDCTSCAFWDPCRLQRKGVSVDKLIEANYEVVDRSVATRPVPFTKMGIDSN